VRLVLDRIGELGRKDLGGIAPLVALEQLGHVLELPELVVEEPLPDLLDARVGLELHAAPVVVDLGGLVQEPLLEPRLARVGERLVLGDVLLLDRGDLGVELARERIGERGPHRHVVVAGLVLGAEDRDRVQLGADVGLGPVVRRAHVVDGVAVLDRGRSAGQHVGVALQDVVGIAALHPIHERGVAIEVVEVLEQPEAVGRGVVGVGLGERDGGRDLDGDLLEADGGLEHGLVGRIQPIDQRLLVMVDAAHERQLPPQVRVHARAQVREPNGLVLEPVHEDHAHAGEGIVVELSVGLGDHFTPGEDLILDRRSAIREQMYRHGLSPLRRGRLAQAWCPTGGDDELQLSRQLGATLERNALALGAQPYANVRPEGGHRCRPDRRGAATARESSRSLFHSCQIDTSTAARWAEAPTSSPAARGRVADELVLTGPRGPFPRGWSFVRCSISAEPRQRLANRLVVP
jgi:hypothetical protein